MIVLTTSMHDQKALRQ